MSRKTLSGIAVVAAGVAITAVSMTRAPARTEVGSPIVVDAVKEAASVEGIVKSVGENSLAVDVKGMNRQFVVPETCDIRKDRRPAELESLIPGDRVVVVPVDAGESMAAVAISAFGVM